MCLREGNYRGKVPFSSYLTKGIYCQHDLSLLTVTLITWPRSCLSDLSTVKILFFPLSVLHSLERSDSCSPIISGIPVMPSCVESQLGWLWQGPVIAATQPLDCTLKDCRTWYSDDEV